MTRIPLYRTALLSMLAGVLLAWMPAASAEAANIQALVSLKKQRMEVIVDGKKKYVWPVSTGRDGWRTPPGKYYPFALTRHYYSNIWKMNLPYLVSISQSGIAIHGTDATSRLGRTASHGCIRLSTPNAAKFYALIEQHGMSNTEVLVTH